MGYGTLRTSQTGAVLRAVLDANDINVITWQLMMDLNELLDKLANDETVKIVVFESAVKDFFSAHLDLRPDAESKMPPMHPDYPNLIYFMGLMQKLSTVPVVTIALVEGRARAGGLDFMMACDMRFGVKDRAIVAPIEARVSLMSASIPAFINHMGLGRASEWFYSGHDMDAEAAEKYGILNRSFATSKEAKDYVDGYCATVGKLPRHNLREMKQYVAKRMYPLGSMEEINNRFVSLLQSEETAKLIPKLMELAPSGYGEEELNLSEVLMKAHE
ncbi:ClpP/crotonase [Rhizodiscina lignyota]|uniref:ClpP/crotonase n=1 Tax=Rhizodiscina lignyota TaxID=1504668 RepID=A0A9P4I679_9PEZI|nr:ClpP/crotonase [Rhizodiscina lignyota]